MGQSKVSNNSPSTQNAARIAELRRQEQLRAENARRAAQAQAAQARAAQQAAQTRVQPAAPPDAFAPTAATQFRNAPPPAQVNAQGTVAAAPGQVSVQGSAGGTANIRGVGLSAEVSLASNLTNSIERHDGLVTLTVGAELRGTAQAGVDFRAFSLGGSVEAGASSQYQLTLSEEDYQSLLDGDIPVPNPLNPETLRDGMSIRVDQGTFQGAGFEAGFETHGVEFGVGAEVEAGEGTSLLVQRDANEVRVTAGPTQTLRLATSASVGVAGVVELTTGRQVDSAASQFRSASFDTSTQAGTAAFNRFARTGTVPSEAAPGVTDPVFVRSVTQDFTRSVELNVLGEGGPVAHWDDGSSNIQVTEHADGTRSALARLHWAGGVDIEVRGPADADGFNPDDFELVLRAENVPEGARASLAAAFTNDPEAVEAFADGRGPIQLRLTADDIAEIQDRVRPYLERGGNSPAQDALLAAEDPIQFVARLAAMQGGFANTADTLSAAMHDAGDGRLPGELVGG